MELKKKIGKKALESVRNDECLFLDNSTTCYYFAKAISESNFKNLTILTNSFYMPELFLKNDNIQVFSTGGLFLNKASCYVGESAVDTINKFNGDKFFLSVNAISVETDLSGVMFDADPGNMIKRTMFNRSKQRICMVDSSKFGRRAPYKSFLLSEIDKIITDNNCDKETREEFAASGNKLIIA